MDIETTEHRIGSGRAGLSLYLRNKRSAGDGQTLLLIHGATYPGSGMFDHAVEGESWMDWLAARGFDVWCMDILGYGQSDRPPEMSVPAADNGPIVDTEEAVRDVRLAVDFICAERRVKHIDLLGYSWGTAITGQVAGEIPEQIRRLVLYGALWERLGTTQIQVSGPLGAYRTVTAEAAADRWVVKMTDAQKAAIAPWERIVDWSKTIVDTDPDSGNQDPPVLRAPTGVVKDVTSYWLKGKPTYDPARIQAPTLVVVGEWDMETTIEQGWDVYQRLTGAAQRRYTVIGQGTHTLLLENHRHDLYRTVEEFLRQGL